MLFYITSRTSNAYNRYHLQYVPIGFIILRYYNEYKSIEDRANISNT